MGRGLVLVFSLCVVSLFSGACFVLFEVFIVGVLVWLLLAYL